MPTDIATPLVSVSATVVGKARYVIEVVLFLMFFLLSVTQRSVDLDAATGPAPTSLMHATATMDGLVECVIKVEAQLLLHLKPPSDLSLWVQQRDLR